MTMTNKPEGRTDLNVEIVMYIISDFFPGNDDKNRAIDL